VAVAVERSPHLVLDADYRIVEIGPAYEASYGHLRDRSLWDAEPEARPVFQPYYEIAWRTGEPVELVQFFNGRLVRIEAVAREGRLQIFWEVLHRIDILTLDGLRSSLQEATAIIERCEDRLARDRARGQLHALEGGRP
jgi:hypothetical protein